MSTFTDYLTGIADAIRTKKGTAGTIPAANFAAEIIGLETGGGTSIFSSTNLTIGLVETTGFRTNAIEAEFGYVSGSLFSVNSTDYDLSFAATTLIPS